MLILKIIEFQLYQKLLKQKEEKSMYKREIIECPFVLKAKDKMDIRLNNDLTPIGKNPSEELKDITIEYFALCHVFNDKSENKEYDVMLIKTIDGKFYSTGSDSLINRLIELREAYADLEDESLPFRVSITGKPSKKRQGENYLSANLII